MYDYSKLRAFDPQGVNLSETPMFKYQSPNDSEDAILTIKVTRISGSTGAAPFQLFGALNGIHSTVNTSKFPGYIPADGYAVALNQDKWLKNKIKTIVDTVGTSADYASFKAALNSAFNSPANLVNDFNLINSGAEKITEWLEDGSLKIRGEQNPITGPLSSIIISCEEVPYRTLIENLKTSVLLVKKMRVGYSNEVTLDRSLSFVYSSMFGSDRTNNLVPRRYFEPMQQQSKIVDINQGYMITGELAINSVLAPDENEVSFVLDVTAFQKNAIASSF